MAEWLSMTSMHCMYCHALWSFSQATCSQIRRLSAVVYRNDAFGTMIEKRFKACLDVRCNLDDLDVWHCSLLGHCTF